jgi:hypothetical protein
LLGRSNINSTNGKPAVIVTGEGGTDEAWYNPTATQYYFAREGRQQHLWLHCRF